MKKLFILLMVLLPLGMFAQDMKIAYVDYENVFTALPDIADFEKKMTDLNEKYTKELQNMQAEHTKKSEDFVKTQEEMTEAIKLRRIQEIQDIEERMQNLMSMAEQDIQKQRNELLAPIYEKVNRAIEQVSETNKYTYVLNKSNLLFVGSAAVDATPLVRKQLGI